MAGSWKKCREPATVLLAPPPMRATPLSPPAFPAMFLRPLCRHWFGFLACASASLFSPFCLQKKNTMQSGPPDKWIWPIWRVDHRPPTMSTTQSAHEKHGSWGLPISPRFLSCGCASALHSSTPVLRPQPRLAVRRPPPLPLSSLASRRREGGKRTMPSENEVDCAESAVRHAPPSPFTSRYAPGRYPLY